VLSEKQGDGRLRKARNVADRLNFHCTHCGPHQLDIVGQWHAKLRWLIDVCNLLANGYIQLMLTATCTMKIEPVCNVSCLSQVTSVHELDRQTDGQTEANV